MPISLEEDLRENLKLGYVNGKLAVTKKYFAKDLTAVGAIPRLAQALDLTATGTAHTGANLPKKGDSITVTLPNGVHTLYANGFEAKPWADADAEVDVTFDTTPPTDLGLSPVFSKETGATFEQAETDFDATNLALPFASRTPLTVSYTDTATTPDTIYADRPARVPILVGKEVLNWTRAESTDPAAFADLYVCKTNSVTWKGYPPETALCLSILGRNPGTNQWSTCYQFAIDKEGKFRQVARYFFADTGLPPKLTAADVAASNGIKEVVVQGQVNFNLLNLNP